MSDVIIKAEGLGKKYVISHQGREQYTALRDVISRKAKRLVGKNDRINTKEDFWALKDISFDIKEGEAVGIIGRNGAGKSTLLKLLSRITEPSTGRIELSGRVASLLEVGTGFHPELTGRENVFLNGAILGMSRAEIRRKFDEIVDFAGVEKFLDTPVKRYSSGMYVRLAFSVAAHLEPEILVVDEVLSVGDSEFQQKCLGKMDDVSKNQGRTVLFVSHQLGTIMQLCTKSILLNKGELLRIGKTAEIINHYIELGLGNSQKIVRNTPIEGNHYKEIAMVDEGLNDRHEYNFDESISILARVALPDNNPYLELAMRLMDKNKNAVFTIHQNLTGFVSEKEKSADVLITIPSRFLTPGRYSWVMCINHPGNRLYDVQTDILSFTILETGSEFARYDGAEYGNVFAKYTISKI